MPVTKYRNVADMPPPPAAERGSEAHLRRWLAMWARAHALGRRRFRTGVQRFTSIEAMWASDPGAPDDPGSG